jgi:hypothetical protein
MTLAELKIPTRSKYSQDLVEGTKQNSHWDALVNLCNGKGKIYNDIIKSSTSISDAQRQVNASRQYLLQRPFKGTQTDVTWLTPTTLLSK